MKNALLIAGLFLGSVAAAVIVWTAVGGSGGGRRAALVEPTGRGSIGELTIEGLRGASALPVRSFYWHAEWIGASLQSGPLEVLRVGDEVSPAIFTRSIGNTAAIAFLDVRAPEGGDPYLRYALTNAKVAEYRGARHEKIGLSYRYGGTVDVTVGSGTAPAPDPSDVIGYMTLDGERRAPILGFDSGLRVGGERFDAVIRRPLDESAAALLADLVAQTLLGTVTIELQTSGETEPHVTYQLENNVRLLGLSASAAAGVAPTLELKLDFRRMQVNPRGNSACYDTVPPPPHPC